MFVAAVRLELLCERLKAMMRLTCDVAPIVMGESIMNPREDAVDHLLTKMVMEESIALLTQEANTTLMQEATMMAMDESAKTLTQVANMMVTQEGTPMATQEVTTMLTQEVNTTVMQEVTTMATQEVNTILMQLMQEITTMPEGNMTVVHTQRTPDIQSERATISCLTKRKFP